MRGKIRYKEQYTAEGAVWLMRLCAQLHQKIPLEFDLDPVCTTSSGLRIVVSTVLSMAVGGGSCISWADRSPTCKLMYGWVAKYYCHKFVSGSTINFCFPLIEDVAAIVFERQGFTSRDCRWNVT